MLGMTFEPTWWSWLYKPVAPYWNVMKVPECAIQHSVGGPNLG